MPTVLESFGAVIHELRKARNFTQEQLGEAAGLHPVYISSLERGKKNPSLESIAKLSEALGISASDMLGLTLPKGGQTRNLDQWIADRAAEIMAQIESQRRRQSTDNDRLAGMMASYVEAVRTLAARTAKKNKR